MSKKYVCRGEFMAQFVKAYHEIIRDENLKPIQKAVYLDLLSYRNSKTKLCCPSQKTIAKDLNVEVKTVGTAIDVLVEKGYLEIQSSKKNGFITKNNYTSFPKYDELENQIERNNDINTKSNSSNKFLNSEVEKFAYPERNLTKFKELNKELINRFESFVDSYMKELIEEDVILAEDFRDMKKGIYRNDIGEYEVEALEGFEETLDDSEKAIIDEYVEIQGDIWGKEKYREYISDVLGTNITNKQLGELYCLCEFDEKGDFTNAKINEGLTDYKLHVIENEKNIKNKFAYLKKCIENRIEPK